MNWLSNVIRPRIRSLTGEQKDVPDNLWSKCPKCDGMLFHKELKASTNVCYHCHHHMALPVHDRLELLFDGGKFDKIDLPKVPHDPLKFKDQKKYVERLKASQTKTKEQDALMIAKGTIGGQNTVIAAFNFAFMGGSMGTAVGEGIVRAAKEAIDTKSALIIIPSSGGARMQEGMLSLMQMPRTIIAVDMVKEQSLPYIVLLTNPTTGGVSASFAMVGDIHIAEPGATIGFAGRRVIEETVRETLPDDFQTAEYLLDHGMVDMVVARDELSSKIGTVLNLLMNTSTNGGSSKGKKTNGSSSDTKRKKGKTKSKTSGTKASVKKASDVKKAPANATKTEPTKIAKTKSAKAAQ
ncbi:MAG: acetyl-CoA carboxylase carboxyl transferase subunit beta [Micavibrio sp.]|nr:acetyl-CoA carboxylase carboxyl transferase subunit beta [Micavibrio sp.]